jgi:predicted lipoprotein with Yx(FWY)xxD motif
MKRARVAALSAIAGVGLFAVAACSGNAPGNAPVSAPVPQEQAPQGPGVTLAASQLDPLGKIVTDSKGFTLYRFDKDTAKPAVSNCDAKCAEQWPPALVEGPEVTVTGVDTKMIGTVKRKDGTKQLTLNGWPLYRYAKDTGAGEANGQGVGGTWFAATPEGKKAQGAAPAAKQEQPAQTKQPEQPSTGNSGGGGYGGGYGY